MIKTQYGHHPPSHNPQYHPAQVNPTRSKATTQDKPKEEAPAQATSSKKKIDPPEPPLRIYNRDAETGRIRQVYYRVGFLGEGGFARVYEVADESGKRKAVKVICKANIKTQKNKTKLWAEIKLHRELAHPHIVRFEDCFEDEENVYMLLELCENGTILGNEIKPNGQSLMDILRRRKRYTEPEARCILVQLIGACQYMHQHNVIHRDLKLGNLFLDQNMELKVGDLGLAALIEKPGDRKKTICGTPNYIAPEVLFDTANGHSFEVDVWSVGVILYTMLIGKPPFQTKDIKAIYKRIKDNYYEFPADKPISDSAKDLIMSILEPNPKTRPTLENILRHRWFVDGEFPRSIPHTAMDSRPSFRSVTPADSKRNFHAVFERAKIGLSQPILAEPARQRTALGPSILQQERDFKNAVQPDSPISALLHSAKQPLVQAPAQIREAALLRKISAAGAHATLSPARRTNTAKRMEDLQEESEEENMEHKGYDAAVRQREIATQKARIVSQMTAKRDQRVHKDESPKKQPTAGPSSLSPARTVRPAVESHGSPARSTQSKPGLYDTVRTNLDAAFSLGPKFCTPEIEDEPRAPRVFVEAWLDYVQKYGMGFAMNDGTISVHFNDSSSLAFAPAGNHFDYIEPAPTGDGCNVIRENYRLDDVPTHLLNKVYLTNHFKNYMTDKLLGDHHYVFEDLELTKGMVFITKYLRMKHVMLFRLSNDVLQFNFYDHTKLILSKDGLVVSVIDKHYILRTWSLQALMQPMTEDIQGKDRKRIEGVVHKLQYARDVLTKIRTHAMAASKGAVEEVPKSVPSSSDREAKAPSERRDREPRTYRETRSTREVRPIRAV